MEGACPWADTPTAPLGVGDTTNGGMAQRARGGLPDLTEWGVGLPAEDEAWGELGLDTAWCVDNNDPQAMAAHPPHLPALAEAEELAVAAIAVAEAGADAGASGSGTHARDDCEEGFTTNVLGGMPPHL